MTYMAPKKWRHMAIHLKMEEKNTPETNTMKTKTIPGNPGKTINPENNPKTTIWGKTTDITIPYQKMLQIATVDTTTKQISFKTQILPSQEW